MQITTKHRCRPVNRSSLILFLSQKYSYLYSHFYLHIFLYLYLFGVLISFCVLKSWTLSDISFQLLSASKVPGLCLSFCLFVHPVYLFICLSEIYMQRLESSEAGGYKGTGLHPTTQLPPMESLHTGRCVHLTHPTPCHFSASVYFYFFLF